MLLREGFCKKSIYSALVVMLICAFALHVFPAVAYADTSVADEVRGLIQTYYIGPIPPGVLDTSDVREMVNNLGDPYSQYFSAEEFNDFVNSINMRFSGIGIYIDLTAEGILVTSVIDGSPAMEVGIQSGDIITEADSHPLAGLSLEEALSYIKGPEGSFVNIKVKRGNDYMSFNVQRRAIEIPTVIGAMVDGHIGYIELSSFGENSANEFAAVLNKLEAQHPDSFIVDVRDNPGGFLTTAMDIAGYFIGSGVVVTVKDKTQNIESYKSAGSGELGNKPVILLVNGNSASASEILSAALKDYGKAFLVGTRTYGKGTVQSMFPLSDGGVLKLTVQEFFSPKGNVINKIGVSPDLEIPGIDPLQTARLLLSGSMGVDDKVGYVKLKISGKEFMVDLSDARTIEDWQIYASLVDKALSEGDVVYFSTQEGWKSIPSDAVDKRWKFYFPTYKEMPSLKDVPLNKTFTIAFTRNVDFSTINEKTIELIDAALGKRIPLILETVDARTIKAVPKQQLQPGRMYYMVISDAVKGSMGENIKEGTVTLVITAQQ